MPAPRRLEPKLSAHGALALHEPEDGEPLDAAVAERLERAFRDGPGNLLFVLGAAFAGQPLPPTWAWLRELARVHLELVRVVPEGEAVPALALPAGDAARLLAARPAIVGADHLDDEVIARLWATLDDAFRAAHAAHGGTVGALLASHDPGWHAVGRVVFNLAENRKDPLFPFAFVASYTTRLTSGGKAQHLPLGRALEEYAGKGQHRHLVALLSPVQRAAAACSWLAEMVQTREIFEPVRWTASDAARLLSDMAALEKAGVVVRMPQQWGGLRPSRPRASASVGTRPRSSLGEEAVLDFDVAVTIDGEPLSDQEIDALIAQSSGLALFRGRWVEVDAAKLERARAKLAQLAARFEGEGVSFNTAAQLVAGAGIHDLELPDPEWAELHAGPWLAEKLASLRAPDRLAPVLATALRGTLRPYQELGVRWLDGLTRLGLGALLADDMGLGKTIQVIALLLVRKSRGLGPSLLVAPASLLGNWQAEVARFAPTLRIAVAHASAMTSTELTALGARTAELDLIVTTYGMVAREPRPSWLVETRWDLVVADEAQALKNAETRTTRAMKSLSAHTRVALSGTPIENRLGDLWSLFDFINPGLLGSAAAFTRWMKRAQASETPSPWAPLRELVKPYLLRRKKTDKQIVPELPDKTELDAFCSLSRRQAALYQEAVDDLAQRLRETHGIERRGLVLASLMRLKQICNHPAHWTGDGDWTLADSGKLLRLRELVETIAAVQDKVLVFTQFREIADVLASCLATMFGVPGLVLTGETAVARRKELVRRFQEDDAIPFFVLLLKAGGTGLNLTAASHVIHFDRWWNPAVEDQATDRAFRIGQKKNVMVHKLVCRGTIEERIAALLLGKQGLARDVIEGGAEVMLTELSDAALLDLVRLDLGSAVDP